GQPDRQAVISKGEIATGRRYRQSVTAITSATSARSSEPSRRPLPSAGPAAEARIGLEARGIPGCNAIARPEVMALDGRGRGSGASQAGGLLAGRVDLGGGRGRRDPERHGETGHGRKMRHHARDAVHRPPHGSTPPYSPVPSSLTIRRLEANANHGAVTAATTTTTTTTAGDARPGQGLHPCPRRFRLAHNLLRLPARLILVACRLLLAARA